MSHIVRPRRPGPVPLFLPCLGALLGAVSAPLLLEGPVTGGALSLLAAGLLMLSGGAPRGAPQGAAVIAGWTLLVACWARPAGGPDLPPIDEPLLFEVELGPAPLDSHESLRPATALRAWFAEGGAEAPPIWRGPTDLPARVGVSARSLGAGSRVLLTGRLARERSGAWVLHPRRAGPVVGLTTAPLSLTTASVRRLRRRVSAGLGVNAPPGVRALFVALVLGDRRELSPSMRTAFTRTGTAHLLAISGLHVGGCWLGARALARWALLRLPVHWTRGGLAPVLAGLVAWWVAAGYVVLAGAPVSGRRALGMLAAVVLAGLRRRRVSPWNTLAMAVVLVLAFDPSAATALGFQLSVVSVAFLIAWTPAADEARVGWWARLRAGAGLALATGAIGAVATAPLVGGVWGQVPVAGVWANALVVPLLGGMTVPPLLLGSALGAVAPALGAPFVTLAGWAAQAGLAVVVWLAAPSRAPQIAWAPSGAATSAFYLGAALLMVVGRRR